MTDAGALSRIDSKLSAWLAITLDQSLRDTAAARSRPRSIDQLLADAGLSAKEIGALLGPRLNDIECEPGGYGAFA